MVTQHEYLSINDLAEELNIPKKTIYAWRSKQPQQGPKGFTIGKHVRFRRQDVNTWIDSLL